MRVFTIVSSTNQHNSLKERHGQWRTQEFCAGVQQIQLRTEDKEKGIWGSSPLVRGSVGSCNLVQEISFHIVKYS